MGTPARGVGAAGRVTVALLPEASAGLADLAGRTGMGKTDLVNRAISLYAFVTAQLEAGRDLHVRDPETGEAQLVRFF
jgi:hypothetical protein